MATAVFPEFKLSPNAYTAFDATSLKRLMIERLNVPSNTVFTDQNFEGSNLNAIIDIVAYSYQTLLFYLNQTSSEAVFTEVQLYENINRIVKLLNYNPVGAQTCALPFVANSSALGAGVYTIPRYSFLNIAGVSYTFTQDVTFEKTTETSINQILKQFSSSYLLYQGKIAEYPSQTANGLQFETITLLPGENVIVDNFNTTVYVLEAQTGRYFEYQKVDSLFLYGPQDRVCEIRLNENRHYEIKFGDNITGRQLQLGDQIAVYFLQSDGPGGQISVGRLNNVPISLYNTPRFNAIFTDVKNPNLSYLTAIQVLGVNITNEVDSTSFFDPETVDSIKLRAPQTFTSQYRLVNAPDYENFVYKNFSNFVYSTKVLSNEQYLNAHLKYLTDRLKLNDPNLDTNVLSNQILFSSSCNFNNVYIYCVPKTSASKITTISKNNFVTPAQKNFIVSAINSVKTVTVEPVIMDPVYMAFQFGFTTSIETPATIQNDNFGTTLVVTPTPNVAINKEKIRDNIVLTIQRYFDKQVLGGTVNLTDLNAEILSITGVQSLQTVNKLGTRSGLSFIYYNYQYPNIDVNSSVSSVVLDDFMFPYLPDYFNLSNLIIIK
jgi:hypothetical protein